MGFHWGFCSVFVDRRHLLPETSRGHPSVHICALSSSHLLGIPLILNYSPPQRITFYLMTIVIQSPNTVTFCGIEVRTSTYGRRSTIHPILNACWRPCEWHCKLINEWLNDRLKKKKTGTGFWHSVFLLVIWPWSALFSCLCVWSLKIKWRQRKGTKWFLC